MDATTKRELESAILWAAVGRDDVQGPKRVEIDLLFDASGARPDRESEAIACCVCGMPIEPESEAEFEACDRLGVHTGECFRLMRREAERTPIAHVIDECEPLTSELMREILP